MKQDVLISEFLEELQHRADERFKGRLDQSFVSWYVEAEFGDVSWQFTDGPNDSGIDAVVWCENDDPPVAILQSKFSEGIGKNKLGTGPYDDFETVVREFRFGEDQFEAILDGAADELRKLYRKAYERLESCNTWHTRKKAFRLITTATRRPEKEFGLLPPEGFVYSDYIVELYKKYRIVQTPKARSLELAVQDKLAYRDTERGTTSYLFNARLSDFRKYFEKNDVARLVARNIRYNLAGRVGRAVRATYEKKPKDFWYLHNGLTIICDEYIEKDQVATLVAPSVINGAQTLYSMSSSPLTDSPAFVVTRVIVRGRDHEGAVDDDQWLQRVIRGVNTQNRVRNSDFRSNDPEQVELQRKFKEQRVFYERKRGEWKEVRTDPKYKGHARLAMPVLGQILTAVKDDDGQGVIQVKRGTEAIFEEKPYKELFPSRSKVKFRFKRIYFAYRLFRLLNKSDMGCASKREYRMRLHSFWNILWVLHRVVAPVLGTSRLSVDQLRTVFDEMEGYGIGARRARKAINVISKAVWHAYKIGRKKDPEHYTPATFFKGKYGNRAIEKVAIPRAKRAAAPITDALLNSNP